MFRLWSKAGIQKPEIRAPLPQMVNPQEAELQPLREQMRQEKGYLTIMNRLLGNSTQCKSQSCAWKHVETHSMISCTFYHLALGRIKHTRLQDMTCPEHGGHCKQYKLVQACPSYIWKCHDSICIRSPKKSATKFHSPKSQAASAGSWYAVGLLISSMTSRMSLWSGATLWTKNWHDITKCVAMQSSQMEAMSSILNFLFHSQLCPWSNLIKPVHPLDLYRPCSPCPWGFDPLSGRCVVAVAWKGGEPWLLRTKNDIDYIILYRLK